jgi:hypothetical protein
MNSRLSDLPVSTRREQAQRRVAANRAAIAAAWADVEQQTVVIQARAHRAIDWTRTLSAIAAMAGAIVAFRRTIARGNAGPALRTVAATTLLGRIVPSALRLYLRRP